MEQKLHTETLCIQAGYSPASGEPRQIPIIQSTTFKYATSEDMGKLFDLEASGYFYSRLQNPTCDYVAAKIAEMEGGTAGMLTSSGQAANFFSLFNCFLTHVEKFCTTIAFHLTGLNMRPSILINIIKETICNIFSELGE